jgi:hypothetical protein
MSDQLAGRDALRDCFVAMASCLAKPSQEDAARLRNQVFVLVDERRSAGDTPEQIIRQIKEIAADALGASRMVYTAQTVGWVIERYYSTP